MSLLQQTRTSQEKLPEKNWGRKIKEQQGQRYKNKCNYCKINNHEEKYCYNNNKAEKSILITSLKT